jgi:hypothetical protein
MSGKYADNKDPRAELARHIASIQLRAKVANPASLGEPLKETLAQMKDAERRGDRKRASLLAQLGLAERQGNHEQVARLRELLATETSAEKKVD